MGQFMNSDRTGMTSKGLKQSPSHLCRPRGTSARHQSSSQSLGQQPYPLVGVHLWVGGNYKSLHAMEGFQMGGIWFCIETEFSYSGSQHKRVEREQKFRYGSYASFLQFPKQYPLICLRLPIFRLLCNRRGTQWVYGGFKFHILIVCSEHHSGPLRSSAWKSVFTWRLRKVE